MGDAYVSTVVEMAEMMRLGAALRDDRRSNTHITAEPIFMVQDKRGRQTIDVQPCLTMSAARAYIARHRHNLKDPFVFVKSGYDNVEWVAVRRFLKALTEPPDHADEAFEAGAGSGA